MTSSQKSHSNKKQEGQKKGKKGVISEGQKRGEASQKVNKVKSLRPSFCPQWCGQSPVQWWVGGLLLETASDETYEEHCTALKKSACAGGGGGD